MKKNPSGFHYAFLVLIACCAMAVVTAITVNCAGIFFDPVTRDLRISRGSFALYLTIQSFSLMLALPIAGNIMAKANARIVLSVFVLINAIAIGAMSTFTSVFYFYVAAVFLGVSQSFMFAVASPTLINRWFKGENGFFIGLSSAFTGIGAVVLNPVGGYIIENYSWRIAYLVFSAIIAFIVFPLVACFIRSYPSNKGLEPYYLKEKTNSNNTKPEIDTDVPVLAAIKSTPFIILSIFEIALGLHNSFVPYLPSYANSIGHDTAVGAATASASMVGILMGKIFLGYLNDKTVIGTMTLCGVCSFLGITSIKFIGPGNLGFLLLGAFLFGICVSASTVQAPLLVKKIFGIRQFSQIYSIVFMIFTFAFGVGQSLWGFVADAMGGSYFFTLSILMVLGIIVPIASSLAYKSRTKLTKGTSEQLEEKVDKEHSSSSEIKMTIK